MSSAAFNVKDEVARAYYSSVTSEPQSARNRAQVSFTISSAIASALIATGALSGFDANATPIKAAGVVVLLLWLASAALFVRAVASPVGKTTGQVPSGEFVDVVLGNISDERDEVLKRQRCAHFVAAAAALCTLGLIVWVQATGPESPERKSAVIWLSVEGRAVLAAACGPQPSAVPAKVDPKALGRSQIELEIARCSGRARKVDLPSAAITAVRF